MRRSHFLYLGALACVPRIARAQSDVDPAITSTRPALRVLLGAGDATPLAQGFLFEGRPYRGTFERTSDGRILNLVGLEEYLYGVVPTEMPPHWPPAALGAQAICARTYVLQRSDPRRDYDLVPSELDQVYRGMGGESPAASAAVDATAGSVLMYDGAFAQIAYSSCCGGHTEASADAWNSLPVTYLQGVACSWCTDSPNYRWSTAISLDAVRERFADRLDPFGNLVNIRIDGTDPSGRARAFELQAEHGSCIVKGSAFRISVGARTLRSLLLTNVAPPQGDDVAVAGGGLGHGVGLCQWGARGLALANRSREDILALYFPGTTVDRPSG